MARVVTVEELLAELEATERAVDAGDMTPALNSAHRDLTEGFRTNIESRQAGSDETPWPPRKDTKPHPLLILSEALLQSVSNEHGAGHVKQIEDGGRTLQVGIDGNIIPYAATQNFGGGSVPPREYLYATDETLDGIHQTVADEALVVFE